MATHLVIGSNRGIGLEITRQLQARGDTVVATCRTASAPLSELGVDVVSGADIATDAGIAALREGVGDQRFDHVYVVAGVLKGSSLSALDIDTIRQLFEVNSLGPLRAVAALNSNGNLGEGTKVGLITSRMGSIEDNTSGSSYAYRMSKAALNMAGRSLAHDLQGAGVAVCLLHPGFVRTEMTGGNGHVDADESAAGLIARVDGLSLETTGSFWHMNGESLPW